MQDTLAGNYHTALSQVVGGLSGDTGTGMHRRAQFSYSTFKKLRPRDPQTYSLRIRTKTNNDGNKTYEIRFSKPPRRTRDLVLARLTRGEGGSGIVVWPQSSLDTKLSYGYFLGLLALVSGATIIAVLSTTVNLVTGTSKSTMTDLGTLIATLTVLGIIWIAVILAIRFGRWNTRHFTEELARFLEQQLDARLVERKPQHRRLGIF